VDLSKPAVFLDRDGTINREVNYLWRPEQLELLPGAAEGLRQLRQAGFCLVVITNQAGVARGYYGEADVHRVHERLQEMLQARGAGVDAFYYCPHHPEGQGAYRKTCSCRKPGTGLFERAAQEMGFDLRQCYVVGDKASDILPGVELGCRTILVRTGYGQAHQDAGALDGVALDHVADTLLDAADWILQQSGRA
jgi:D-glycero-D-manno-heptose 1,7-bisphosphate phosphatase